jgi:aminoglycoside phosphotransferase (APT) family kinase protein
MTALALPNPERDWERHVDLGRFDVAELEDILGERIDESVSVLPGGLANTNVRVGSRVVRFHRRDPSTAQLEACLLAHPWRTFRTPAVLGQRSHALVLEHVEHGPLLGSETHGFAVGRALAEIHSIRFADSGWLAATDGRLEVSERFDDPVGALVTHVRESFADDTCGLAPALRARVIALLEEASPELSALADPSVLLHADFKASNLHWTRDDRLLVLDWEFAYSGARLSDVGQLLRWTPPRDFVEAFASGYRDGGGTLVEDWPRWAAVFDLVNLAGVLTKPGASRVRDVTRRIEETLGLR